MYLELIVDGERINTSNNYSEMDLEERIREYGKIGFGLSKETWEVWLVVPSKINSMPKLIIPKSEKENYIFNVEYAYELKKRGWSTSKIASKYRTPIYLVREKLNEYEKAVDI